MQYGESGLALVLNTPQEVKALEKGRTAIGIEKPGLCRTYDDDYTPPAIPVNSLITPDIVRPEFHARIEVSKTNLAEAVACLDSVLCIGGFDGFKMSLLGYKRAARQILDFVYE